MLGKGWEETHHGDRARASDSERKGSGEMASRGETSEAVRRWAEDAIRGLNLEPATVTTYSVASGYAHPVGGPQNPAGLKTYADRWELEIFLSPDVGHDAAEQLLNELEDAAATDRTLGGRVQASRRWPQPPRSPEQADSRDLGEGSWRTVYRLTTYRVEHSDQPS